MGETNRCKICNQEDSSPCGGCGNVFYCGKQCQRKHWKTHKQECKSYKVTTDNSLHGNSVVAARDIRAGEVIMECSPLVTGPRLKYPRPLCVGCHKIFNSLDQLERWINTHFHTTETESCLKFELNSVMNVSQLKSNLSSIDIYKENKSAFLGVLRVIYLYVGQNVKQVNYIVMNVIL